MKRIIGWRETISSHYAVVPISTIVDRHQDGGGFLYVLNLLFGTNYSFDVKVPVHINFLKRNWLHFIILPFSPSLITSDNISVSEVRNLTLTFPFQLCRSFGP